MDISFIIGSIILCVCCAIVAFFIGKRQTVKIERINNDQLKAEQQQLIQENKKIKQDNAKQYVLIQNAQSTIEQAEKLKTTMLKDAEDLYNQKVEQYDKDYCKRKEHFEDTLKNQLAILYNDFEEKRLKIQLETEQLENDLCHLRKARKATIEANKRAAAIQENKENYSLQISAADANDIKVMESIRHLLVKPRILSMLIWQTYFQPLAKKLFPKLLGQGKVCGIYKITNTETEECYIGQSVDIYKRWSDHCKCGLGIDTPAKNKLYEAMQKYGLENFTFELLEECDSCELNDREKYYIDMFNSVDYGYNATVGNNG